MLVRDKHLSITRKKIILKIVCNKSVNVVVITWWKCSYSGSERITAVSVIFALSSNGNKIIRPCGQTSNRVTGGSCINVVNVPIG